jgi:hypothetical protein
VLNRVSNDVLRVVPLGVCRIVLDYPFYCTPRVVLGSSGDVRQCFLNLNFKDPRLTVVRD